jgi:REP element-mobilizing transposase RayT
LIPEWAKGISASGGTFHVTTNAKQKVPWCTEKGVPEIIIDNLVMTKNLHKAEIFAFCILPDHMHLLLRPGSNGLSAFMHSFKRNSTWQINQMYKPIAVAGVHEPRLRHVNWQNGFHD